MTVHNLMSETNNNTFQSAILSSLSDQTTWKDAYQDSCSCWLTTLVDRHVASRT